MYVKLSRHLGINMINDMSTQIPLSTIDTQIAFVQQQDRSTCYNI